MLSSVQSCISVLLGPMRLVDGARLLEEVEERLAVDRLKLLEIHGEGGGWKWRRKKNQRNERGQLVPPSSAFRVSYCTHLPSAELSTGMIAVERLVAVGIIRAADGPDHARAGGGVELLAHALAGVAAPAFDERVARENRCGAAPTSWSSCR